MRNYIINEIALNNQSMKIILFYISFFVLLAVASSCSKLREDEVSTVVNSVGVLKTSGQEICGTPEPTLMELEAKRKSAFNRNVMINPNQMFCINIFFHIVRNNDGSGGYPVGGIGVIIDSLNRHYNRHGIYFKSVGQDYINNTAFSSIDSSEEAGELAGVNVQQNAIDYYIVNNLWNTSTGSVVGTALSIPSKRLVINRNFVTRPTSAHEIGHCLDLMHTFQGTLPNSGGCAENINGSNCLSCGDEVCDTPADNGGGVNNGYMPDLNNIMSYYSNRWRFTLGQTSRMKNEIFSNAMLLNVLSQDCVIPSLNTNKVEYCAGEDIVFTIQNGGSQVGWNLSQNLSIINQNVNSITVRPNSPYDRKVFVEAILPFQTLRKDVWIGSPLVALNMYCTDVFSTTCDLISSGATRPQQGADVTLSLTSEGLNSSTINDLEWEETSGNFIFVNSGGYVTYPMDNGRKSLGSVATLKVTGSGALYFKIRARNSCGWGDWKYVFY